MIAKVRSSDTKGILQKPHKLAGLKPGLYKINKTLPEARNC